MNIRGAWVLLLTASLFAATAPGAPAQNGADEQDEHDERPREERITGALGHRPFSHRTDRVTWYVGNGEFMRLQPLPLPERGEDDERELPTGWTLVVENVGRANALQEQYRLLFRDGTAVGGEHLTYTSSGEVASRRRVDADGEETLSERVTYRGDGTVRSVRRCDQEGCLTARFSPPGGGGEESIIGESLALQIRFNTTSRPEYIRVEREGISTEEFLTYGGGGLIERRVVRGDTTVTTTYREGRLRTEEERVGERLVRRVENTYDERDRRVLQKETRRNLRRETRWSYDTDDEYVMERFENDVLVLREEVTGDTTVRTHFRGGNPVFRETRVAGEITSREIYVDGEFEEEDPR
ncbi:MAG: hypothetical protein ACOCYB_04195 [Alkalispirochaeta sp.]